MEYQRFGNTIFLRIDRGEEILEKIRQTAEREDIKLAGISAIGAINSFVAGIYKPGEKKYYSTEFTGDHEIVSLTGTINTMNGEFYSHLHISAANDKGEVYGGHLNMAIVSATCEAIINIVSGSVDRRYDEETGLNIFDFE